MAVRSASVKLGRQVRPRVETHSLPWREKVLAAACVVLLVAAFWIGFSIKGVADSMEELEAEGARLEARHLALLQERDRLTEAPSLERLGKRLGLHKPRPKELVVLRER